MSVLTQSLPRMHVRKHAVEPAGKLKAQHAEPHLVALLRIVEQHSGITAQLLQARLPILHSIHCRLEQAQGSGAVTHDLTTPADPPNTKSLQYAPLYTHADSSIEVTCIHADQVLGLPIYMLIKD